MWPVWAIQLVVAVALTIVSYLLQPKQPSSTPTAATDPSGLPKAKAGDEIPIVYGTIWLTQPQVGWYGDFKSAPIKSGGKK